MRSVFNFLNIQLKFALDSKKLFKKRRDSLTKCDLRTKNVLYPCLLLNLITFQLHVLDEIVDRPPSHQMLHNLYRRVDPVKLLVDGKMQGTFVGNVKKMVFDGEGADGGRCKLVFMSNKEYSKCLFLTYPIGAGFTFSFVTGR